MHWSFAPGCSLKEKSVCKEQDSLLCLEYWFNTSVWCNRETSQIESMLSVTWFPFSEEDNSRSLRFLEQIQRFSLHLLVNTALWWKENPLGHPSPQLPYILPPMTQCCIAWLFSRTCGKGTDCIEWLPAETVCLVFFLFQGTSFQWLFGMLLQNLKRWFKHPPLSEPLQIVTKFTTFWMSYGFLLEQ